MNNYKKKKIISIYLLIVIYEFVFPFIFKDNDFPIYFDKIINISLIYIIKNIYSLFGKQKKNAPFSSALYFNLEKVPFWLEIVILDYQLTKYYLGETLFAKIICKKMSKMVQSDSIRIAILN